MKKALLQMHLAVLLWGFTGLLGRAIALDSPVLVWYRMLMTALFMAAILFYRKQWVRVSPKDMVQLVIVGFLMGLHWIAFYGAIKFANISIALVCLSTASVFTSLLDPFVNKGKFNIMETMLGLLALVGVYLIYQFQQLFGVGILFGVIAAILSSVFTVLNKRVAHKYPIAHNGVLRDVNRLGAGYVPAAFAIPFLPADKVLTAPATACLALTGCTTTGYGWFVLSLCCTVWAQSLSLNALKKLSSFTVTLTVNLEPVYGILLAFFFYSENRQLHTGFFVGMGADINYRLCCRWQDCCALRFRRVC